MISTENKKYIIYLLKYLGVALIAGSVVHVGTLENGTTRYIVLGIIGLLLMLIGNILEAKQNSEQINLKYLTVITALSLATGFFSGGIQHYFDNPGYAGYLLSVGLFFSYITFFMRDKIRLYFKYLLVVTIISGVIIIGSSFINPSVTADHHDAIPPSTENLEVSASITQTHVDLPNAPAHSH